MQLDLINLFGDYNPDFIFKILISTALGILIGIEREMTNKTAGLRTHILLCLGCTVFTILSIHGFTVETIQEGTRVINDPARIAAQILTGIGFIGGGAVLHHGVTVYGLTTAATLWITASIGMAVGTGSYYTAIITALITVIILVVIRQFENIFLIKHITKTATIKASIVCQKDELSRIHDWFFNEFKNIQEINTNKPQGKKDNIKLTYIIDIYDKDPINSVHKKLISLQGIESLTLKQIVK